MAQKPATRRLNPNFYKLNKVGDRVGMVALAKEKFPNLVLNADLDTQTMIRRIQDHQVKRDQALTGQVVPDGPGTAVTSPPAQDDTSPPLAKAEGAEPMKTVPEVHEPRSAPQIVDSDPVMSDEAFQRELDSVRKPEDYNRGFEQDARPPGAVPPGTPHGPTQRIFRHPSGVTWFFNPLNGLWWKPTEKLMRNRELQPVYTDPPEGAIFGTT